MTEVEKARRSLELTLWRWKIGVDDNKDILEAIDSLIAARLDELQLRAGGGER
jgi:outer membrane protein TolC